MSNQNVETWLPVNGYEDLYAVSDCGNVRRTAKYRNSKDTPLRPSVVANYPRVTLCKDSQRRNFLVHRLVAYAFLGIPDGLCVNHKNGNKLDNRLANLEVVTYKENEFHKWNVIKTGNRSRRIGKPKILTSDAVIEIRKLRAAGLSQRKVASQYGVGKSSIMAIDSGKSWWHV